MERETRSSVVRFVIPKIEEDSTIEAVESLVPLHNAPAHRGDREARKNFPDLPHVAVFSTAFHATLPAEAAVYAVSATVARGVSASLVVRAREELVAGRSLRALLGL